MAAVLWPKLIQMYTAQSEEGRTRIKKRENLSQTPHRGVHQNRGPVVGLGSDVGLQLDKLVIDLSRGSGSEGRGRGNA